MMRVGTVLALTITLASSCRTPGSKNSSGLSSTELHNFEDELGMKPGVGLEGVMEDVRGECVDYAGIEAAGASQEATFNVHLIETHRDLIGQLGISAASQIKSAVPDQNINVSQKTKFAMGNTFSINRYAAFVMVSAVIKNETSHLKDVTLKDDIKQQLEQDPAANLDKFRLRCGDSFMSGFTTGGEFHAVIEISSDSDQMTAQLKNSYQANLSFGGTDNAGMTSQIGAGLKSMSQNRKMRIWTFQRGGAGDSQIGIITSVDQLMERLKGLADSVRIGGNPRPLTATFSDYFTLASDLPATYRQQLLAAQDVMDEMSSVHTKLLDIQANLDFVLIHPDDFIGVDAAKLNEINSTKKQIDQLIAKALAAGKKCAEQVSACKMDESLKVPEVGLPKRKPTLESLTNERLHIKTKLTYINTDELSDGWFNPPECYLVVYAGGNGKMIPVRRTPTTYAAERCKNLQTDLEIPVALVKDAFKTLGVKAEKGWVQVNLMEDDPSWDDEIGKTSVWFKDLQNGAQLKAISNDYVSMELGFEFKY